MSNEHAESCFDGKIILATKAQILQNFSSDVKVLHLKMIISQINVQHEALHKCHCKSSWLCISMHHRINLCAATRIASLCNMSFNLRSQFVLERLLSRTDHVYFIAHASSLREGGGSLLKESWDRNPILAQGIMGQGPHPSCPRNYWIGPNPPVLGMIGLLGSDTSWRCGRHMLAF